MTVSSIEDILNCFSQMFFCFCNGICSEVEFFGVNEKTIVQMKKTSKVDWQHTTKGKRYAIVITE